MLSYITEFDILDNRVEFIAVLVNLNPTSQNRPGEFAYLLCKKNDSNLSWLFESITKSLDLTWLWLEMYICTGNHVYMRVPYTIYHAFVEMHE